MIFDAVENMERYFGGVPKFERIYRAYQEYMISPFDSGKLEIEPGLFWANVSTYATKPAELCRLEAHKAFCDVQIMVEGEEQIGWAPIHDCTCTENFKKDNDIAFFTSAATQLLTLRAGTFMVFFPEDAHMPCVRSEGADTAKKLVFKVRL